jgi:hypothetical protein
MAIFGRSHPLSTKIFSKVVGPIHYTPLGTDAGAGADTATDITISALPSLFTDITISPLGYTGFSLTWTNPTGTWDEMRLVRSSYGFPATVDDGTVLYDHVFGSAPPYFTDESVLRPGRFYYYTLFVHTSSYGWWPAGSAVGLLTSDYDTDTFWWDRTPTWYRQSDMEQGSPGPLERFYELLGYEYDRLRTEVSTIETLGSIDFVSGTLLPFMAQQYGATYEPAIGMRQNRVLIKNIVHLHKTKGSKVAIEGIASALSGYGATAIVGPNLMLTRDDSDFGLSTGHWYNKTNCSFSELSTPAPNYGGRKVLRVRAAAGGLVESWTSNIDALPYIDDAYIPVVAGVSYSFAVSIKAATAGREVSPQAQIFWLDSTGNYVSNSAASASFLDSASSWSNVIVRGTAPAGATRASVRLYWTADAANNDQYLSNARFYAGTTLDSSWETPRDIKVYMLPVRTNYIKNPNIETDASHWSAFAAGATGIAVARSTAQHHSGSASLAVTATGAGNWGATTDDMTASAGTTYTGSLYVRAGGNGRTTHLMLRFLDGSSNLLTSTEATTLVTSTSSWQRMNVTATAPVGTATMRLVAYSVGGNGTDVLYLDDILLEESAVVGDYFDGSFSPSGDYVWSGTTNESESYYYPNYSARSQRVSTVLADYVPMDATYTVIYGVTTIPASSI